MGNPSNWFNPRGCCDKALPTGLVGSTDTINSSDIGKLLFRSSNKVVMATGGSSFSTSLIAGIIAGVAMTNSTGSSGASDTAVVQYRKLNPSYEIEGTYSTLYSTLHPGTTDIGNYIGLSTAATIAGAVLSMANIGNTVGTTDGRFMKITGFSTNRRKVYGFPVYGAANIAW